MDKTKNKSRWGDCSPHLRAIFEHLFDDIFVEAFESILFFDKFGIPRPDGMGSNANERNGRNPTDRSGDSQVRHDSLRITYKTTINILSSQNSNIYLNHIEIHFMYNVYY
jgi:hypothetical protein